MITGRAGSLLQWLGIAVLSLTFAAALRALDMPGAALLGALCAGAAFALSGVRRRMEPRLFIMAQAVTACVIASRINPELVVADLGVWLWAVLSASLTLAAGVAVSLGCTRFGRLDPRDAIWGFMPAVAGAMIAMSEGRAADSRMVAVIQIFRLMIVLLAIAGIGGTLDGSGAPPAPTAGPVSYFSLVLVLFTLLVAPKLRRFPAVPFVLPLLVGSMLTYAGLDMRVPQPLVSVAFAVVGLQVGLRFTDRTLRDAGRSLPEILLGSLVLVTCGIGFGLVIALVSGRDLLTALLATLPGSLDSLSIIAIQTGADVTFVLTLQMVRMFAVLGLTPIIAAHLSRRRGNPKRSR